MLALGPCLPACLQRQIQRRQEHAGVTVDELEVRQGSLCAQGARALYELGGGDENGQGRKRNALQEAALAILALCHLRLAKGCIACQALSRPCHRRPVKSAVHPRLMAAAAVIDRVCPLCVGMCVGQEAVERLEAECAAHEANHASCAALGEAFKAGYRVSWGRGCGACGVCWGGGGKGCLDERQCAECHTLCVRVCTCMCNVHAHAHVFVLELDVWKMMLASCGMHIINIASCYRLGRRGGSGGSRRCGQTWPLW